MRSSLPQYLLIYSTGRYEYAEFQHVLNQLLLSKCQKSRTSVAWTITVALTSVVMKIFERLVLRYLISKICLDSHQFAYNANRSVDVAVALCLHSILQHLEAPIRMSQSFLWIINLHLIQLSQLNFLKSYGNWGFNDPCSLDFGFFAVQNTSS